MMLPTSILSGTSPPIDVASSASLLITDALMRLSIWLRSCFERIWYAARRSASAKCLTRAISASFFAGGCQSHSGLPPSRTSSWIASIAFCISVWPNTTAPSITSSGSWSASDSTISTAASVPATTRLSFDVVSAVFDGLRRYWPFA